MKLQIMFFLAAAIGLAGCAKNPRMNLRVSDASAVEAITATIETKAAARSDNSSGSSLNLAETFTVKSLEVEVSDGNQSTGNISVTLDAAGTGIVSFVPGQAEASYTLIVKSLKVEVAEGSNLVNFTANSIAAADFAPGMRTLFKSAEGRSIALIVNKQFGIQRPLTFRSVLLANYIGSDIAGATKAPEPAVNVGILKRPSIELTATIIEAIAGTNDTKWTVSGKCTAASRQSPGAQNSLILCDSVPLFGGTDYGGVVFHIGNANLEFNQIKPACAIQIDPAKGSYLNVQDLWAGTENSILSGTDCLTTDYKYMTTPLNFTQGALSDLEGELTFQVEIYPVPATILSLGVGFAFAHENKDWFDMTAWSSQSIRLGNQPPPM